MMRFWLGRLAAGVVALGPVLTKAMATPPAAIVGDPAAEARGQIQALLTQMAEAAARADQEGYLACVSMAEPVFAAEQKAWALDLSRKKPEKVELTMGDAGVTVLPDGTAEARIRWSWRMPEAKDRDLGYTARFVREGDRWKYAGEKWHTIKGEKCLVSFAEGLEDAAKIVADVLPEVRAHVHTGFELENDADLTERVQQVKVYSSMKHLQHSIYLSYSDALGGWNEPGESIKIIARSGSSRSGLRNLLAHEYGHVATFQFGPKINDAQWWILEGVAELAAEAFAKNSRGVETQVRRWAGRGQLVEWHRLADFRGEATQHMGHVYTQGHHMVAYISERFGRTGRNQWLRAMAQGKSLEDATLEVFKVPFAEVDKDWRASLTAEPK